MPPHRFPLLLVLFSAPPALHARSLTPPPTGAAAAATTAAATTAATTSATTTVTSSDGSTIVTLGADGALTSIGGPSSAPLSLTNSSLSFVGLSGFGECAFNASATAVRPLPSGGALVARTAVCASTGAVISVQDAVEPAGGAVRWTTSYSHVGGGSSDATFSVPLGARLNFADGNVSLWTPWTRGCVANDDGIPAGMCYARGVPWTEPFSALPLPARALFRYGNLDSGATHAPFGAPVDDSFTLPLFSVFRDADDVGATLALSPDDATSELLFDVRGASVAAVRLLHRLDAAAPPLVFTALLRAHAASWRPALAFWVAEFADFAEPHVGGTEALEGLGGYSWVAPVNASYAASVGFKLNWDLSGTFMPYDGLFAPYQDEWLNLGPINAGLPQYNVTYARINDFYTAVQAAGLNSLSYFDVGNWGVSIATGQTWPNVTCGVRPSGAPAPCPDPAGSNAFLQHYLSDALLARGWSVAGGSFDGAKSDWVGTTLMDPAEPFFEDLLVEQLTMRLARVPATQGFAVDRFDYTAYYNYAGDDMTSWVPGPGNGAPGPARSLVASHRHAYSRLAGVLHAAGKVFFGNCNTLCRADVLESFDGIFSEGSALNAVAWGGLRKPTILWTYSLAGLAADALHALFQQHLLMRVFPMAPMPGNDHSITPGSPAVQAAYEAYAPLFRALAGAAWVLDVDHPVATTLPPGGVANVFVARATPGVLLVPLVLGGDAHAAAATVRPPASPPPSPRYAAAVLLPGAADWAPLADALLAGGAVSVPAVPLAFGAAILRLTPSGV
jgi:hypothetical protein